jgi:hypothetical protein
MAINLDKMRAKMDRLEGKNVRKESIFWKPQDGEQTIRILPVADGDPFKEFWFHYNLGNNRGFLSPWRNYGEEDPLNDFVRKLFNDGTEDSVKMAKNLMARQRFFSPVIVRGEEEKGVRLWGYGKMAYKELISLALNPDYGDITDPETGTDLVIKYGKPPGASFPQTTITPRRRPSPLCADNLELASQWVNGVPDFDAAFADSRKTPAEVGRMLDEWLAGEADASDGPETERYGSNASPFDKTQQTQSSVDQKLNELLSQEVPF